MVNLALETNLKGGWEKLIEWNLEQEVPGKEKSWWNNVNIEEEDDVNTEETDVNIANQNTTPKQHPKAKRWSGQNTDDTEKNNYLWTKNNSCCIKYTKINSTNYWIQDYWHWNIELCLCKTDTDIPLVCANRCSFYDKTTFSNRKVLRHL